MVTHCLLFSSHSRLTPTFTLVLTHPFTHARTRVHTSTHSQGNGNTSLQGPSPRSAPEYQPRPAQPCLAPPPHAYAAPQPGGPAPRRPFVAALEAAFGRRCRDVWRSAPPGRCDPRPCGHPASPRLLPDLASLGAALPPGPALLKLPAPGTLARPLARSPPAAHVPGAGPRAGGGSAWLGWVRRRPHGRGRLAGRLWPREVPARGGRWRRRGQVGAHHPVHPGTWNGPAGGAGAAAGGGLLYLWRGGSGDPAPEAPSGLGAGGQGGAGPALPFCTAVWAPGSCLLGALLGVGGVGLLRNVSGRAELGG